MLRWMDVRYIGGKLVEYSIKYFKRREYLKAYQIKYRLFIMACKEGPMCSDTFPCL